jgi:hypothetical protein
MGQLLTLYLGWLVTRWPMMRMNERSSASGSPMSNIASQTEARTGGTVAAITAASALTAAP